MAYRIKEKFWSLGNSFNITDEAGNEKFVVKGEAFSWGDQLSFQDTSGKELAHISQKLLTMTPKYEIVRDGKHFAEVVKEFSWLNEQFSLDLPGPNDYSIEGAFWTHDYTFSRKSGVVATVSKDLWGWTDCYGVQIVDGEDDVAILCACIVIDQVLHDDKD